MKTKKPTTSKKYFTVAEANAVLPLARSIVRDIAELANRLQERYDRLTAEGELADGNREELEQELEQDQDKSRRRAGCGAVRLGEEEVGHWHELDAGFAGRRKIRLEMADK